MKNDKHDGDEATGRRELLGAGGAAIAMLLGLAASACSDDDDNVKTDGGGTPDGGVDGGMDGAVPGDGGALDADVATLNALLTAEYTAIKAYAAGGGLIAATTNSDPLFALRDAVVQIATSFVAHHTVAAEALVEAITALGGTPVAAANVSFTPPAALVAKPTITNVLRFAAGAERSAGVSYNKAVSTLEAAKHRFLASAIEGVATQHFIVIAALVLGLAQPGPSLATAGATSRLVPRAFVSSTGTAATRAGLDVAPPANYWA